jgi:hypothetical protein
MDRRPQLFYRLCCHQYSPLLFGHFYDEGVAREADHCSPGADTGEGRVIRRSDEAAGAPLQGIRFNEAGKEMKNSLCPSARRTFVKEIGAQLLGLGVGIALALTAAAWPSTNSVDVSYLAPTDDSTNAKVRTAEHNAAPNKQELEGSKPSLQCEWQNPMVDPGRICWHRNLDEACAAARKSGKPVLLFQMMGRLDQEFC